MLRRIKPPTPTAATAARSSQRTAILLTPSIKPPRRGLWEQYRLLRAVKVPLRRASTAIVRLRARQPMATSMRRQTGMSTRTPEAVGIRPKALVITPRVTREPTLLLLGAMGGSKRAAGHRPLAEAEAVGNPGRRALVVRQAEAGEGAGEGNSIDTSE